MADKKNEKLLKEIREDFTRFSAEWRPIYDEGDTDMRYIAGDPWEPEDRRERDDAGRPCISHDEINQYVNQTVNTLRQSPRSIQINPAGSGSTDKTAEFHEEHIRAIEYKCQAPRSAYIPAFEQAVQRGLGFFKIKRNYISDRSFDQEISIEGISNPSTVLYDPDCKKRDWSDAKKCFILSQISKDVFKANYPKAQIQTFTAEMYKQAPGWLQQDSLITAEYWKAVLRQRNLLLLGPKESPTIIFEDELEGSKQRSKILKERVVDTRKIMQYITNGLEILEESEQPGTYIPIIPVIGRELYVVKGGKGPERVLLSLVRLARDPQMSLAYLNSLEMEEAGLTPKVPYIGYKGQFESDVETWDSLTKIPHAYAQIDAVTDQASGQVLPIPQRQQFAPNFQAYEVAKDSCRRAVQAAMGISPLPTAAQRNNEKSGIALQKIVNEQAIGSFHFTDNLNMALELAGRIIMQWRPAVYDNVREVGLRKSDGTHSVVRINTAEPYVNDQGEKVQYSMNTAENHDLTIETGQSFASQREEAQDFANTVLNNIEQLPLDPAVKAKFIALIIKLRNIGPIGDAMVELLDPQQNSPQQLGAMLQQAKQQVQQMHAYAQQLEGQVQKLQFEKEAKVVSQQGQMAIEKLKIEAQIGVAEIQTKAQQLNERIKFVEDLAMKLQDHAHDRAMQADQQQHEAEQADLAAQNQAAMATQQQQAEAQQPAQ